MTRRLLPIPLLAAALLLVLPSAGAGALGVNWGTLSALPGAGALNLGNAAEVVALTCTSVGNCAAVGDYTDATNQVQAFVDTEVSGTWGSAVAVPGLATLNVGGSVADLSIACGAPGSCVVAGDYKDAAGNVQIFTSSETTGGWSTAATLAPSPSLGTVTSLYAAQVACPSASGCLLVGTAFTSTAIVAVSASEVGGAWGSASALGGTSVFSAILVIPTSLVCTGPSSCLVSGVYGSSANNLQGFVDEESSGTWSGQPIPGLATLNAGNLVAPGQVACSSAGNCAVVGAYSDSSQNGQAYVAAEVGGTWQDAVEVPGTAGVNSGGDAAALSVSCPADGHCTAVGYLSPSTTTATFFTDEFTGGSWSTLQAVPGLSGVAAGAIWGSIACPTLGQCHLAVAYGDGTTLSSNHSYLLAQDNGTWASATTEVSASSGLAITGDYLNTLACAPDGGCAAGGAYADSAGHAQAAVLDAANAAPPVPSAPKVRVTPGKGQLVVTLVTPAGADGAPVTYQVSVNGGPWRTVPLASHSWRLARLKHHATFRVRVRAVDSTGPGSPSATAKVKVR